MAKVGECDHLNRSDPVCLPLDLDALADSLIMANYGVHRLLSAVVRANKRVKKYHNSPLINEIGRLLDEGYTY